MFSTLNDSSAIDGDALNDDVMKTPFDEISGLFGDLEDNEDDDFTTSLATSVGKPLQHGVSLTDLMDLSSPPDLPIRVDASGKMSVYSKSASVLCPNGCLALTVHVGGKGGQRGKWRYGYHCPECKFRWTQLRPLDIGLDGDPQIRESKLSVGDELPSRLVRCSHCHNLKKPRDGSISCQCDKKTRGMLKGHAPVIPRGVTSSFFPEALLTPDAQPSPKESVIRDAQEACAIAASVCSAADATAGAAVAAAAAARQAVLGGATPEQAFAAREAADSAYRVAIARGATPAASAAAAAAAGVAAAGGATSEEEEAAATAALEAVLGGATPGQALNAGADSAHRVAIASGVATPAASAAATAAGVAAAGGATSEEEAAAIARGATPTASAAAAAGVATADGAISEQEVANVATAPDATAAEDDEHQKQKRTRVHFESCHEMDGHSDEHSESKEPHRKFKLRELVQTTDGRRGKVTCTGLIGAKGAAVRVTFSRNDSLVVLVSELTHVCECKSLKTPPKKRFKRTSVPLRHSVPVISESERVPATTDNGNAESSDDDDKVPLKFLQPKPKSQPPKPQPPKPPRPSTAPAAKTAAKPKQPKPSTAPAAKTAVKPKQPKPSTAPAAKTAAKPKSVAHVDEFVAAGSKITSINGTYIAKYGKHIPKAISKKLGKQLIQGFPVYVHNKKHHLAIFRWRKDWWWGYYKGDRTADDWIDYYVTPEVDVCSAAWESIDMGSNQLVLRRK